MMRCEKSDGCEAFLIKLFQKVYIVAIDVGASERLVTAGRVKRRLCEGILLW